MPFCLPERLLVQLHNDGMAARARKQVDRLRSLFPRMMESLLAHPKTAAYARKPGGGDTQAGASAATDVAPVALAWAFAMVRSRAFAAGDDRFAFVPFLVSGACPAVSDPSPLSHRLQGVRCPLPRFRDRRVDGPRVL